MLIPKEVIRPGCYWYRDEKSGQPRKLVVTPDLCRYWNEQGNAMLSAGLTVPVPYEHDFDAHPMTPADKLKNNAGWVKGYRLEGDRLISDVEVTDAEVAKKLPHTIRWTSPWINSFTDGSGKEWRNVISHLALTTRPRIINQQPFGSVAAALSMATEVMVTPNAHIPQGFHLSRAGLLKDSGLPAYPMAFSMWSGGTPLATAHDPPKKKGKAASAAFAFPPPKGKGKPDVAPEDDEDVDGLDDDIEDVDGLDDIEDEDRIDLEPIGSPEGDVSMQELLCDLLGALGIPMESSGDEEQFKRDLYNAAMTKIHELTAKGQAGQQPNRTNPPGQPPNNPKAPGQTNPLIQQEQQPMFMSLEEINRLDEPLKSVALSMYNETQRATQKAAAAEAILNSLRDKTLKEENEKRNKRVGLLGRLSPRVKADLDAMLAMPSMALSMGDGGAVVDPMASTLAVLEKGLADMPRLLTADATALEVQHQPKDADMLTDERVNELADSLARSMGCPPEAKAG